MMKGYSIISFPMISNQNLVNSLLQVFIICNVLVLAKGQNNTGATPSPSPSPSAPTPTTSESASGNKPLKIAIPEGAFKEFVSITEDPLTGEKRYGGFSIDVFQAVFHKALSDPPKFQFEVFPISNGSTNGSYDGMLQAVNAKDYDGAVGDITIRYDRTHWVDFTLPYSNTGITMMIYTNNHRANKKLTGIKLIPLIKGLVSAALVFCFISALVFWFVEFRNDRGKQSEVPVAVAANGDVQQPNKDDSWQRETLRAIIHTRLVIVLCFLVLLFLSSCYVASLTSLMTAQRQKGPTKTLDEIIRKNAKIGTQKGSYMPRLLVNQKGFNKDQIEIYDTEDEMVEMLAKGSAPGGVVAVIDESPHLNVFLSKNCNKGYQLVPSIEIYAQGSGFAFQRGSPLVNQISKGILKLMDGGELATIQGRTIGDQHACDEDSDNVDSNLLDLDTMWILFAGAIGFAILVIILYMVYFGTTFDLLKRRIAYPCNLLPNSRARNQ